MAKDDITEATLKVLYDNKFDSVNIASSLAILVKTGHSAPEIQRRLQLLHDEKLIVANDLAMINPISPHLYDPLDKRIIKASLTHKGELYYYDRFLSIWAKIKQKDPNAISTALNIIGFILIVVSVYYAIVSYYK